MPIKCPKCDSDNTADSKFCKECGTQLLPLIDVPEVTKTLETPRDELTRGTTFGNRYEIIEELGRGGMGRVYRVDDTKVKEEVALKLIKPEVAADKRTIERFRNELKSARKIRHKNVCQMFDLGEYEGIHYITMEYVTGEDLKSLIRRMKIIPIRTAISITNQVCEGLMEAHKLGIVHRDLKPSNIMIDKAGNARIMDFGIARSIKGEAITGENVIIGTPDYMSPEQVEGEEADQRSDIYSLGVVLYEMLTGERPFKGDTSMSIAVKHKSEAPPNPKWLNDQISDRLSRLVLMCLEKDRERRYQSAEELLSALSTIDAEKIHLAENEEKKKSVAVLPFEDMSPGKDNEYFSDGLTEEIISDLSLIQDLLVISRSSAMTYKGTRKKIKEIGQELNVRYVLEGSVRKAGNNLKITAQLIDALNDTHLWAEKYSGTMDDVFDIQEKVSRSIVDALKVKLSPEESRKITERPIDDITAYDCFLKARQAILHLSEEGLHRALQLVQTGLNITGENELLNALLGYVYVQFVNVGVSIDESYLKQAEDFVNKAFSLNPDSALAHSVMGQIHWKHGKIQEAVVELKKTLAIELNNYDGLCWLAWIYLFSGKVAVARPLVEKLVEIDPLTAVNYLNLGNCDLFVGKFEDSLQYYSKAVQLEGKNPLCRFGYVWALISAQRLNEAFEMIDLMAKDMPQELFTELGLFYKYSLQKVKPKVRQQISDKLKNYAARDEVISIFVAECYALLEEKEKAITWIEHGVRWGFINYPYLNEYDPLLENIRNEPRFKKLMERVKHEWENFEV